jgi:glutamyl-tRNA synthetase
MAEGRADGRYAPSPTGPLHLGNLRTALVAWLFARSSGSRFVVRMEDLDRATSSRAHERAQLDELGAIGIDWDGEVVRQSDRFEVHRAAIAQLTAAGLTYPCYCTRREIREAASAPHGDDGQTADAAYPGTCRDLSAAARAGREAAGRRPALRLRVDPDVVVTFDDVIRGTCRGAVDDVVLCRNDGVPAYNLAVVVDDAAQGIDEVVRGDDLVASTPRQIHIAQLLDMPVPRYAHIPLVLGSDGVRLAKRHGAVTLEQLAATGVDAKAVRAELAHSLGLCDPGEAVTMAQLTLRFDPAKLPRQPWLLTSPAK